MFFQAMELGFGLDPIWERLLSSMFSYIVDYIPKYIVGLFIIFLLHISP